MIKFAESLKALERDPFFAPLIKQYGPPDITKYHGTLNIFSALLRSIVYQQISGHSARAIYARFSALFPHGDLTPEIVLKISVTKMRTAGLSAQKISYIKDASAKFNDGTIMDKKFPKMSSKEIKDHLVQIKGVGTWTAHMLLIFTLLRLDVLPTGDLGIRKGFQTVYKLRALPSHTTMERLAKPWREHASVASWYLWRVADGEKR